MLHHSGRITGFLLFALSCSLWLKGGGKREGERIRNHRGLNYKNGEKKPRKRLNKQAKGKATTVCI